MADTLDNVRLPAGKWVDLYDATGITVGVQITAQNIGATDVLMHTGATAPSGSDGFNRIVPGSTFANKVSSTGEWALSRAANGLVNVGEV